jgi:hypothetical protein
MTASEYAEEETWAVVPGFSRYEVSSRGRLRSWRPRNGCTAPTILDPALDEDGYRRALLRRDDGKKKSVHVHTLVLLAFVGPRPCGAVVCHWLDIDKLNNRLTNLRWGTHQENMAEREMGPSHSRGDQNVKAKLTEEVVREIRKSPDLQRVLAAKYGVTQASISAIRLWKTWNHIADSKRVGLPDDGR